MFLASPPAAWSKAFLLDGRPVSVSIYLKQSDPTDVVVRASRKRYALPLDLYFDRGVRPHLRVFPHEAYLAYSCEPGAGSGEYAQIIRISAAGLKDLGTFLDADLREWFRTGTIRDLRPAKYASSDMLRLFPRLYDVEAYRSKVFLSTYRFERKNHRFRLIRIRVLNAIDWPDVVRYPRPTSAARGRGRG